MWEPKTWEEKLAFWVIGVKTVNGAPSKPELLLSFYQGSSNISAIFATILSSVTMTWAISFKGDYQAVAITFFIGAVYFSIKTWAFNKCARITCRIWM